MSLQRMASNSCSLPGKGNTVCGCRGVLCVRLANFLLGAEQSAPRIDLFCESGFILLDVLRLRLDPTVRLAGDPIAEGIPEEPEWDANEAGNEDELASLIFRILALLLNELPPSANLALVTGLAGESLASKVTTGSPSSTTSISSPPTITRPRTKLLLFRLLVENGAWDVTVRLSK